MTIGRWLARITWLPALALLGLVPATLFTIWAEAMGRTIAFAQLIPFVIPAPKLVLSGPLALRAAFDATLMLAFGAVHSGLAQEPVQERLARVVGTAQVRALYVIVTGVSLVLVITNWQILGPTVWTLVPGSRAADRAGAALYYVMMVACGRVIVGARTAEFLGFAPVWRGAPEQARTSGSPVLVEGGAYAWVRHPGYACLLTGLLCANAMTLDRLMIFSGALLYLLVGIPVEERKLVAQFGAPYEDYRRRVPALLPFLR